jgi:hypothetical protein
MQCWGTIRRYRWWLGRKCSEELLIFCFRHLYTTRWPQRLPWLPSSGDICVVIIIPRPQAEPEIRQDLSNLIEGFPAEGLASEEVPFGSGKEFPNCLDVRILKAMVSPYRQLKFVDGLVSQVHILSASVF